MVFLFFLVIVSFLIAFFLYGRFLEKKFAISDVRDTPAVKKYDGVDYVPTHPLVLLGHHFSSIAGAGPIIGPIIASLAFGWMPVLLWIVLGTIFVGGVHDYSALIASVRHGGLSIAEVGRKFLSRRAHKLFLAFIWLALVYVLTVFLDLTAKSFVQNGGIATSSIIYILLAFLFGFLLSRGKARLPFLTVIFVFFVLLAIPLGQKFPLKLSEGVFRIGLVLYCFFASVLPVWILLQPRDYLSSYLLYLSVLIGTIGIAFGGWKLSYPHFLTFKSPELGPIFPFLLINVACGAVSGFHSLISSGTTAKQLRKEKEGKLIAYGGMLLEGVVAFIALSTVMIAMKGSPILRKNPILVYATGIAKFAKVLGISEKIGYSFGILALSAFILTTLDTATRIGRYVFQEFFGMTKKIHRYYATLATLILPLFLVSVKLTGKEGEVIPAWKAIWPVFGSTNQLLAALALLMVLLWLRGKGNQFLSIPMALMLVTTLTALFILFLHFKFSIVGIISVLLFLLAILVCYEALRHLTR